MTRKLTRFLLATAYVVVGTLLIVELGLRIAPGAVPMNLLLHFDPEIRSELARELDLTVRKDMVTVPRDDGGPGLWIFPPHYEDFFPYRDEDAVQTRKMDAKTLKMKSAYVSCVVGRAALISLPMYVQPIVSQLTPLSKTRMSVSAVSETLRHKQMSN